MGSADDPFDSHGWREVRVTADTSMEDRVILGSQLDENGCWRWLRSCYSNGYAHLSKRIDGKPKNFLVHRLSYELFVGPIPAGMTIDHLCRVRDCVNPAHMEVVTQRENTLRGLAPSAIHARKTHCPQGHPYDVITSNKRDCSICIAARQHRTYMKNRKKRLAYAKKRYELKKELRDAVS